MIIEIPNQRKLKLYLTYIFRRVFCYHEFERTSNPRDRSAHPVTENATMKNITPQTTVGEIVRAMPARSRIFENLGIDYCCGGKKPLAEVCQAKGLDPATVVALLAAMDESPASFQVNPDAMSLTELCDYIEQVHHE